MQKSALCRVACLSEAEKELLRFPNPEYFSILKFTRYKPTCPKFIEHFWELKDGTFFVPRNFIENKSFEDLTSKGKPIPDQHTIELREEQKVYFDTQILPSIHTETDIVLNVPTGKGKTIMAIYLSLIYGRTTLIVVPTLQLGKQFLDAIRSTTTRCTAGFYKKTTKEIYDFTITTYQFLSGKKKNKFSDAIGFDFYNQFGHIVFDEAHLAAADSWMKIMQESVCKYRTSLTATFRRADGMEKILKFYVGKVLKFQKNNADKKCIVIPVETEIKYQQENLLTYAKRAIGVKKLKEGDDVLWVHTRKSGKRMARRATFINETTLQVGEYTRVRKLTRDDKLFLQRKKGIKEVDNMVSHEKRLYGILRRIIYTSYKNGRTIILLSSNLQFLFNLHKILYPLKAGIVAGKSQRFKAYCEKIGVPQEKMEEFALKKARVVLGIDTLAKTGMDVERADTLIIVHPFRDIEQAVGRISRRFEKQQMLVYYMLYDIPIYRNLYFGTRYKKGAREMFKELGHYVTKPITYEEYLQMKGEYK